MDIQTHINNFVDLLDKERRPSVESRWSVRLILHYLQNSRSQLLDRKYNLENKPLDQEDMHMIPCLKLVKAKMIDCKKLKSLGCEYVMKIKMSLPNLISRQHLLVRSIDGSYIYDYVRWEDYTAILNSKFRAERIQPYYSMKREADGLYIYILNDGIKTISIEGIFNSIIGPYLYQTCDEEDFSCKDYKEFELPISPSLINTMYNMTYQAILNVNKNSELEIIDNDTIDLKK